jgi:protein-S-isoprenylcysteine O-methyltransferase Ste14
MQKSFIDSLKMYFFFIVLVVISPPVFGADIDLSLRQHSEGNHVIVTVQNNSASAALISAIEIQLDDQKYMATGFPNTISPHNEKNIVFTVAFPKFPGSYSLIVTLRYLNEGTMLSLHHVGLFHFQKQALLPESCIAESAVISREGEIIIRSSNPAIWMPVLPDEVPGYAESVQQDRKIIRVKNQLSGFNNNYPYFAVADQSIKGIHYAAFCAGVLTVGTGSPADESGNGRIPKLVLLITAVIFFITFISTQKHAQMEGRLVSAVNKYASRLFLIAMCYLLLKTIDDGLLRAVLFQDGGVLSAIVTQYHAYKRNNFSYFFYYFVDAYYIASLLLVFPIMYFFDARRTAENDKYSSLVGSIVSLAKPLSGRKYWNKTSRLGMLTVFVKFFYIPLLVTWVINNTLHQFHLTNTFHWDLFTVNAYLVALFIYIDTAIYCFGYLFESNFLKNTIRSVEPTVLGWVVCLWCYPPFNNFSFRIFDFDLIHIAHRYPTWVNAVMLCVITVLWGVFAWASLSLGWKASNLTNRGIVQHGPYRFVRHPAYTAKLFVWYIQAVFFGQYFIGLLFGFTVIYMLRAWTEERHLSNDPDYLAYKKAVKWYFIPGLI